MDAYPLKPVAIFSSVNFGPGELRSSLNLLLPISMRWQRFLANGFLLSALPLWTLLRAGGMQDDLGPAVVPRVEVFVSPRCLVQRQLMRDDPRWLGAISMDEVAQITVVGLDVRLAGRDALALDPEEAEVEHDLTFLRQLVRASGIFRNEDAHHADAAGGTNRFHKIIHGGVRHLMADWIVALVADALAAPVGAFPIREFQNLLNRRPF